MLLTIGRVRGAAAVLHRCASDDPEVAEMRVAVAEAQK